jgi:hypothetical protein
LTGGGARFDREEKTMPTDEYEISIARELSSKA